MSLETTRGSSTSRGRSGAVPGGAGCNELACDEDERDKLERDELERDEFGRDTVDRDRFGRDAAERADPSIMDRWDATLSWRDDAPEGWLSQLADDCD